MMNAKSVVSAAIVVFLNSGALHALSWPDWKACIVVPNSDCPLDPGTYIVTGSSLEPAAGVTMRGTGVSPYSTVLQRDAGTTFSLILVSAGTTVTISNFAFDGNRFSFPNALSGCGQDGTSACGPPGGYGCTRPNSPIWEVEAHGAVIIDQVFFWNSPGASLNLNSGTITNTGIYYSRSTVAFLRGGTVWGASFYRNGTAGLNLGGTAAKTVNQSWFAHNRYEMSDGIGGGQLYIDYSAGNSNVYDNDFDGANWQTDDSAINGCYPPQQTSGRALRSNPAATTHISTLTVSMDIQGRVFMQTQSLGCTYQGTFFLSAGTAGQGTYVTILEILRRSTFLLKEFRSLDPLQELCSMAFCQRAILVTP